LERNKLIKRSRDKKDHRVVRLLRTRQGLDLMSEISADLDAAPAKEAA
jgi:DNA-binding MarR family transcriptional regulator